MIELLEKKIILNDNYEIREYYTPNGNVRALVSNECTQSLIYIDKGKKSQIVLEYYNYYNIPIDINPSGTDYLMLGGGGFSYPHYFINRYKDKYIDIVENNQQCINYAKEYFYLDNLIESAKGRINIIIEDAIKYIEKCEKKYDYVLIDLFNGRTPIKEIYTEKNIENLRKIIKENGIIIVNYITTSKTYDKEINQIVKIANYHELLINDRYFNELTKTGNIIIVLSNNEIKISKS